MHRRECRGMYERKDGSLVSGNTATCTTFDGWLLKCSHIFVLYLHLLCVSFDLPELGPHLIDCLAKDLAYKLEEG